jgi:two-component system, OmpR family, alkaline phosphatase synthesis response regulator PhoP
MDNKTHILVVDDEEDLCEILQFNLAAEGFSIDVAYSAEEALEKPLNKYGLILLDVMMRKMSGYQLADKLRHEKKLTTPIIFLTARTAENDLLTGFNVGADDYISKPFSVKEVVARVKAVLKRTGSAVLQADDTIQFEQMLLNTNRKTVLIDNQIVNLTRKEFEILLLLITNQGRFIERQSILDRIWSDDVVVTERNVDVNIARLRKKIGVYGACIKGRSGYGYCFEENR